MTKARRADAISLIVKDLLDHPDAYPEEVVLLPFDPERLSAIFTPERLRIWKELSRTRPKSITELARRLDRDVSRVRQDLLVLQGARLVEARRKGVRVQVFSKAKNVIVAGP